MKQKKSWGQIFLHDKKYIYKIIDYLKVDNEYLLEIGSGRGDITSLLLDKVNYLYCVEVDTSWAKFLENRFALNDKIKIINEDILKFPLKSLNKNLVVFGNIPFHISNQLIRYLVKNREVIKRAYITFQKEFVRKLCAKENSKDYGFLSCYIQYYASVKIAFDIPKYAFYPRPKVDASLVDIVFSKEPAFKVIDEDFFFNLLRQSFSLRRKKLYNVLEKFYGEEMVKEVFSYLNIDLNLRADKLSLENYCWLANFVFKLKQKL
ncbi:MAG: 16S rRNA (adenine(1518)-N(6)/adenine(1519)-N(6))-dimethyltransferase RsmA [Candidatus Omnitrophica bacterium]|nr:16S rRNA (adenine(1518)-N(6)/adenine(1519)-N(6))-dimethyltransferase RsmA [Candidatus Omnitrophota bacterium]